MIRIAVPATRGFTLVEMAITLAVGGILLALALPSFTESRANGKIRAAAAQLQQDLQWARAEAIKRNARVQLNTSASGTPSSTCDWRVRWTNPATGNVEILKQISADEFAQHYANLVCTANQPTISFDTLGGASAGVEYSFSLADPNTTKRTWLVTVGMGGRIVSQILPGT